MSGRHMDWEARVAQKWKNPEQDPLPNQQEVKDVIGIQPSGKYGLPDITALNKRADDDMTPEGVTLNNDGYSKAREQRPPDDTFSLPTFMPEGFAEAFFGRRDLYVSHIASKTGTYINVERGEGKEVIQIWGEKDLCAQAKRDLEQLKDYALRNPSKKKKYQKSDQERIAKVRAAPTTEMMMQILVNREQQEKRQFFKKLPDPEYRDFDIIGHFTWPQEFNPASYLGMNYENLDRIRTEQECFIEYDRKNSDFIVLGRKVLDVEIAVDRIYGVYCEAASKQRHPTRVHLVEPPSKQDILTHVFLDKRHSLVNQQITIKVNEANRGAQCYLTGQSPPMLQGIFADWENKRKSLIRANHVYLRKVVQQALNDILYLRVHVNIKVHFGKLVLFSYRQSEDSTFPLMEFMETMRKKETQSELLRHIGDEHLAKELIAICHGRNEIFTPVHASFPEVTDHPERIYAATFELKLYEDKSSQDVRLEVQFGRETPVDGRMQYYVTTHAWLLSPSHGHQHSFDKTNEGKYKRKGPLDLKCLDLAAGLAWQLEISTYSRLPETNIFLIFGDFIRKIKLDVARDGTAFISFTHLPGLEFKSVVQKTKSQFYISTSNYVFEIVKYEYFNGVGKRYPEGASSSVSAIKPDVRWGANLTSRDWTENLAQQSHLPIGVPGRWDPDVYKFFKSSNVGGFREPIEKGAPRSKKEWDEDGFEEFLGRIKDCVDLIARASKSAKRRDQLTRRGVREDDMD